jgi:hypothetical protein
VSHVGYGSSVANWITTSSHGSRCEAVLLGKAAMTIAGLVFLSGENNPLAAVPVDDLV